MTSSASRWCALGSSVCDGVWSKPLDGLEHQGGPERFESLQWLVWELCELYRRETRRPVTNSAISEGKYRSKPQSPAGRCVLAAVKALQPAEVWIQEPDHRIAQRRDRVLHQGYLGEAVLYSMREYVAHHSSSGGGRGRWKRGRVTLEEHPAPPRPNNRGMNHRTDPALTGRGTRRHTAAKLSTRTVEQPRQSPDKNATAPRGLKEKISLVALEDLRPFPGNPRQHPGAQIARLMRSIERVWTNPILIDETGTILAGHGALEAAKRLGRPTSRP